MLEQGRGFHGRVLAVDLSERRSWVEPVPPEVFRQFLGGYGLGAWLLWRHFPPGADPLSPEACFAIVSGLLTGTQAPFSGRIQIVGKSPLTGTWADSSSGGSVASQLRAAGYDGLLVRGRAAEPSVLVVRDQQVLIEPAGELWGREIPEAFDALRARYGDRRDVGVSAIGPAGERCALIASVMNDRYHAFGRQGFGALFGSKRLKAVVVGGGGRVPLARPERLEELSERIRREYRADLSPLARLSVAMAKPNKNAGWLYRAATRLGIKLALPTRVMRQLWTAHGTTSAVSTSVENGDAPVKNWKGVGARDFPIATKSHKLDGDEVDRFVTKRLSCGDCPMPCKAVVKVPRRGLSDVRRPDYETLIGFGANVLNDDLEVVVACHDACNRFGMDAVSASATIGWAAEACERGLLRPEELDGIALRFGDAEAVLALTLKIGSGEGCGAWLSNGVARAAEHLGRGTEAFAVHVHGQEPAYHDPRFTSLMGLTYIADPTPGRHTAGSASWAETFGASFGLPGAVPDEELRVGWHGTEGKGLAQAHFSNAHQALNGLGLCMFTALTGHLPMVELVNAATGWDLDARELLRCGERIQNLRAAFNRREGLRPADFAPHPRMMGEGDGRLEAGPLKDVTVPLERLREDYFRAMGWNPESGNLYRTRAEELGLTELLAGWIDP